jgi:hypothetical protein
MQLLRAARSWCSFSAVMARNDVCDFLMLLATAYFLVVVTDILRLHHL